LAYHENIKIHSLKTVSEYYLDLRTLFRFLKRKRGFASQDTPLEEITIADIDLEFVKTVTKTDIMDYISFLRRERVLHPQSKHSDVGVADKTIARKLAAFRSFFKYLKSKAGKLTYNPMDDWDNPKLRHKLPRYLTLEESINLLENIDGLCKIRDYCIITIFLNCGLRISELIGLNLDDIRSDHLRVVGKGGKERIVYINDATSAAINEYLAFRSELGSTEKALFIALVGDTAGKRLSRSAVHQRVKTHIAAAGLPQSDLSAHKLRHTAATLMLRNGVDVRTLQEFLGHERLDTTQLYTHVESGDLKIAAAANPLARVQIRGNDGD